MAHRLFNPNLLRNGAKRMTRMSSVAQGSTTQFTPAVSLAKEQCWLRITSPQFSMGESVVAGPFTTEGDRERFKFRLNNRLAGINSDLGVALTSNTLELAYEPFESVSRPEGAKGVVIPSIESCIRSRFWSNPKNHDPEFNITRD